MIRKYELAPRFQVVRILGQMVGGFYTFPLMAKILPSYAVATMEGPTLAAGASTGECMAWEFGSTLVLMLVVYIAATQVGGGGGGWIGGNGVM